MHASKRQLLRKLTLAGLSLGATVQACDSSEEKLTAAHYAEKCALDSDCEGDLVCVFEHCHVECNDDEDCDQRGGRCVRVPVDDAEKSTTIGVCQLPDEVSCTSTDDCKGKQICAEDAQCRDQCSSKNPCFSWLSCSNSGECAAQSELDSNGDLIVGDGGAGGVPTGGSSGSGGTHVGTAGASSVATGGTSGGTPDPGASGAGGAGGDSGNTGGNSTGGSGTGGSGTGGSSAGGNPQSSGGTSATGGNSSSAGDSSQGGGTDGGAGGAGTGPGGDVYVEESDGVEPIPNGDRDHTLPLPKQGSLWLPGADQDWFYADVPDDGRAHVIELLVRPGAGERPYVNAYAALDNSSIGQILVPEGTSRSIFITVGSGTRTNIAFTCDRPGRLDFEVVGITAENDAYEPNNDRYTAKAVALNTDVVGQQIVPYTSLGGVDVSDWFQVTFAAGPAAVNVVAAPANVGLSISMMDETNSVTVLKRLLPGVIGSTPVTIAKAGVYRFQLTDHSNSGLLAFYTGVKPESLDKTYTVRFEQ